MGLPMLSGFLFGVCCAPESIAEDEWLPLVFNSHPAGYVGNEESLILELIRQLHGEIAQQVENQMVALPVGCEPVGTPMLNLQSESPFSQWCAGFMSAHDWLEDLWLEYVPEEAHDELTSIMVILSFFASEALAKAYYSELRDNTGSFEEVAAQVIELHGEAMQEYARIGYTLQQAMEKIRAEKPKPETRHKIARNEPCPCGSGKKFKKCCGSAISGC